MATRYQVAFLLAYALAMIGMAAYAMADVSPMLSVGEVL